MKSQASQVLTLAHKHSDANESAALRYKDAETLFKNGLYASARKVALDSLRHSVGVFHADYKTAKFISM